MEKRDPLRELGNTSDNNEPQEAAKETKLPDIIISKENEATAENLDPGKVGCGKLRLSFLKTFDPLYSESPKGSEVQLDSERVRPKLVIEESDSDRSQTSPLPADVSDDDAAFVDATYIAASDDDSKTEPESLKNQPRELEESLLKFYTPEKFTITRPKPAVQPTSEPVSEESVLSENKDPVSTSTSGDDKLSDSAEEKVHSPAGDISESKDIIRSERDRNEPEKTSCEPKSDTEEKNESTTGISRTNDLNDVSDSNSDTKEVKADPLDNSKKNSDFSVETELESDNFSARIERLRKFSHNSSKSLESDLNKTGDSTEKTPESPDLIKDKANEEPDERVETENVPNQGGIEVPIDLSNDTAEDSEVDEGFKSSEEKVPEDLDKNKGVEKFEVESSEKSELVQATEEDSKEKATHIEESEDYIEDEIGSEAEAEVSDQSSGEILQSEAKDAPQEEPKLEEEQTLGEDLKAEKEEEPGDLRVPKEEFRPVEERASEDETESEAKEVQEQQPADEPHQRAENQAPKSPEAVDESADLTTGDDVTPATQQEEERHLDSGVDSIEESYTKSPKKSVDESAEGNTSECKGENNLPADEILEECRVESNGQTSSDDESKTISEGSIQNEDIPSKSTEVEGVSSSEGTDVEEKTEEGSGDTVASKTAFDADFYKAKMADLSEKLSEQQQENSDLKLQLNASQQAKASLELEIRQKEEIIIKTQAEALKNEQVYKQEIKQLREKIKENSKLIEKDSCKELEEQLKEAKAREAKAISELNQRNKDDLNYQKIMEEYENTIATRFADYQKLKEEHETATRHLANIELAFSDVHQKYERTKTILEGFKANEEALSLSLQACEKTCKQHEEKYESLKAHAKAQIEKSNKEILMLRDKYEMDINKLKAIIKRLEIKCSSLEVSLQQKTEECAALSALCDEVTGKRV